MAPIQSRITAIRRQVSGLQAAQAWGWTIAASLAAALAAGCIDASFRLRAWPLRVMLTAAVVAVIVWSVRRWLVPWWRSSYGNVQIARRLEVLHPRLGERLSSALAFLQQESADAREGSLELRYAVIAEAEAIAADLPLERCIDARPRNRVLSLLICLLVIALGLLAWQPANFARATARLAWPVGGPVWPPRYQLELVKAPSAVALGESFEVEVRDKNNRLPADATILLQFDQPSRRNERHLLQQRGTKLVFRIEQTLQPFRYRVTGGDDDSLPWQELLVVQPPKLTDLISKVQPPEYSGLKPDRGGRLIKLLAGSILSVEGKLDRAASAVRLHADGADHLPSITLAADRLSFATDPPAQWQPPKSAHIWIELVDETGSVTGRDGPLELQVITDAPPAISWDQPGDHSAFTSQALVPILATVKDDLAVQRVELRFASIGSEAMTPQRIVLFEQPQATAKSLGEGDSRPVTHAWDLSQLPVAGEGTAISVQLAARDFHGQETLSPPRRISLISTQDMQSRLVQRQGAILEQLGDVLRIQRQARTLINEVAARQADEGKWQPRDLDVLQSADLQQRQVQRLLKNPDDGLAKQIELLLAELQANRLGEEGIASRMQSLLKQVRRLNDEVLPPLEEELATALKSARLRSEKDRGASDSSDCADEQLPLAGVTEQQDRAVAALESMLGELAQWDSFSRIAREVGLLKQEQQKLREQTEGVRVALALAQRDSEPLNLAKQAAQRQLEAARQFDKLQQRMEQLLAKLQDHDPLAAGSLADALDAAQKLAIGGQMRSAARQLQDAKAGNAVQAQDQVLAGLSEVLDRLASRRDQDAKRQLAALNAAAGELDQLTARGENLAREAAAAKDSKDPLKRQLQRLTKDAQRLAQDVAELARKLERLQANNPAEAAKRAGQSLTQGGQSAAGGDGAAAEQQAKSALEDLQNAKKQLQQDIQKAQADLVREQLARLETELAGLLKRQQNLLAETQRLDAARQAGGKLSAAQLVSLRNLADEQLLLAEAVKQSSETFSSGEAFELALTGVMQAMQRAHRSLARSQTDAPTQTAQQQAITRLKQLLEAARSQSQQPDDNGQQQQPGQEQPAGQQAEVRSIGELKLLETLQLEINRRTAELEAARPQNGEFTAEQLAELTELADEQGQLAQIVLDLIQKPAEPMDEAPAPAPPAEPKPNEPKKPGNPLDDELLKDLKN
jgi:hypothetical protein